MTVLFSLCPFLPLRERCCDGPRRTPESWGPWRRWWRISATIWTLPKAWTPTKTRSITLWTEWLRLCDHLLPPRRPSPHRVFPHAPHPAFSPELFLPWMWLSFLCAGSVLFSPSSPQILNQGKISTIGAFYFLLLLFFLNVQSNNPCKNAQFFSLSLSFFKCTFLQSSAFKAFFKKHSNK